MQNFILGVMVGTLLTAMGVHAAGKDGPGGIAQSPRLHHEREQQFQLQMDRMRQQTELEQARMKGRQKPC